MKRRVSGTASAITTLATLGLFGPAQAQQQQLKGVPPEPANSLREAVGEWRGDANAYDAIGNAHGTLQGGVKYGEGILGGGFHFNGTDGVVRLPDSDALKLTKSFSISAWVYVEKLPDNPTGYGQIVFCGDSRGGYDPFFLAVHSSQNLVFHVGNADNRYVEIAAPIPLHQFVFVTASLDDKTGIMRLSMNNRLVTQAQTDDRPQQNLLPDWRPGLGIGNTQDADINEPFCGVIDEVKIYDTVVGPTEPIFPHTTTTGEIGAATGVVRKVDVTRRNFHTFEIDIQAYIDGYSQLVLQGSSLHWHHFAWAAPGRISGNNFPTIIATKMDGVETLPATNWVPKWPKAQNSDVTNETESDSIALRLPTMSIAQTLITLQTITNREGIQLAVPTGFAGDTLTVKFNDYDPDGADWYHCKLVFEIADKPEPGTPLTGAVTLEGVADLSAVATPITPLTFEFRTPGLLQTVLPSQTAVLEPIAGTPYGTFHLMVPPGTYDVAVKEGHTLRRLFTNITIDGQQTLTTPKGFPVLLLGGDATGHNMVGYEDFEALLLAYNSDKNAPETGFAPAVDFNHDGKVNFKDYEMLLRNYGTAGAE